MPLTPMQILLEGQRDEKSTRALSSALRNRKEVGEMMSLVGTKNQQQFAGSIRGDVDTQQKQKEKQDQRYMTQGYYDDATSGRKSALSETIRHNKAMEDYYRNKDKAALTAQDKALSRGVTDLSKRMEKAAIPDLRSGISNIDAELAPYIKEGGGLPGIGGMSNVGGFAFTSDGRQMQARVAKIRNMILKARSGGAVTPEEASRLLEEFSLGMWNTDEEFLASWEYFKASIDAGERNIMGGYDSRIREQYQMNMNELGAENPEAVDAGADWNPTPQGVNPETGNKIVDWGG